MVFKPVIINLEAYLEPIKISYLYELIFPHLILLTADEGYALDFFWCVFLVEHC